jgi:hypothetical protein
MCREFTDIESRLEAYEEDEQKKKMAKKDKKKKKKKDGGDGMIDLTFLSLHLFSIFLSTCLSICLSICLFDLSHFDVYVLSACILLCCDSRRR